MDKFDISDLDCEERFGLPSRGWIAAGKFSSLLLGLILTAVFYGILALLRLPWSNSPMLAMFFPGGPAGRTFIPLITVLTAMWCLSMLLIKRRKLSVQQRAMQALPVAGSAAGQISEIAEKFATPAEFAAAALQIKQLEMTAAAVPDLEIAGVINQSVQDLEQDSEISFIPINCFIWAVPVLGFTGTVLGLAQAVGRFGTLAGADSKVDFNTVLPEVTGGLATAFETTLIALVLALLLQLTASFQSQAEAEFLQQIKLRNLPESIRLKPEPQDS